MNGKATVMLMIFFNNYNSNYLNYICESFGLFLDFSIISYKVFVILCPKRQNLCHAKNERM